MLSKLSFEEFYNIITIKTYPKDIDFIYVYMAYIYNKIKHNKSFNINNIILFANKLNLNYTKDFLKDIFYICYLHNKNIININPIFLYQEKYINNIKNIYPQLFYNSKIIKKFILDY